MSEKQTAVTWLSVLAGLMTPAFHASFAHAQDMNTWCEDGGQYHPCNVYKAVAKEDFHESYPLSAAGRVRIENINGRVHILAWDRNEVKVEAVKSGQSREQLQNAEIQVDSQPDSIAIRTKYREFEAGYSNSEGTLGSAIVEYTITVPRKAQLDDVQLLNGDLDISGVLGEIRARCTNGKLVATGLRENVKLSTVNNNLEAHFDELAANRIELESANGGVDLTLPSDAKASLQATTVRGDIANEFGLHATSHLTGNEMRGKLGGGGTKIRLSSMNGGIEIHHANDGKAMSAAQGEDDKDDL
jgi:DUF4097 and DUF4098 domain-containing protein YvlB